MLFNLCNKLNIYFWNWSPSVIHLHLVDLLFTDHLNMKRKMLFWYFGYWLLFVTFLDDALSALHKTSGFHVVHRPIFGHVQFIPKRAYTSSFLKCWWRKKANERINKTNEMDGQTFSPSKYERKKTRQMHHFISVSDQFHRTHTHCGG